MKHRGVISFFSFLILCITSIGVYAQVDVKDSSDIAGTWKLEVTSPNKDKTNGNKETSTWNFDPDGTVVISGYNRFLDQDTRFEKSYTVEVADEPIIKIRDGRGTSKYKIIEKDDDEMILKGPYGYYFFERK